MRTPVELRFEKGDPVREYWLSRGEGFVVENRRGRVVGQVVDVVVDPERQRVMSLVVQKARRVDELPAERIQAVVPARDAFVLEGAPAAEPAAPKKRRPRPRLRLGLMRLRLRAALAAVGVGARAILAWLVAVGQLLAGELRRPPR